MIRVVDKEIIRRLYFKQEKSINPCVGSRGN